MVRNRKENLEIRKKIKERKTRKKGKERESLDICVWLCVCVYVFECVCRHIEHTPHATTPKMHIQSKDDPVMIVGQAITGQWSVWQ